MGPGECLNSSARQDAFVACGGSTDESKASFLFVNFLRNLSIDLKVQILRLDVSTNFFFKTLKQKFQKCLVWLILVILVKVVHHEHFPCLMQILNS